MTTLPLSNLRVLDLTHARAGPTCVRQLADWGADVLKIENALNAGDVIGTIRSSFDFQNLHRNKKSICLNLKKDEGKKIFYDLVKQADVVAENFRPDVKHRLKVDYETLSAINPRLVYASISGFGQTGPYQKRTGVDQIIQGMGGLMSITGQRGGPPTRVGIAISDMSAGIVLANGVLIALLERERTGKGRWVQTSLLESMIFMNDFQAARWLIGHEVPGRDGNNHPTAAVTGVYRTRDGHITVAAESDARFADLCKVLGLTELLENPAYESYESRAQNKFALDDLIEAKTRTWGATELIEALNAHSISAGPIYTMDQVFEDPQVKHLKIARPVHSRLYGELHVVGQPIHFEGVEARMSRSTPERGEHTEEVLRDLGYSERQIAALKRDQVVLVSQN